MYSMTIAGKHGHIAPITSPEPLVRKLSKTEYLFIPSGEILKYNFKETKDFKSLYSAKQKCIDIIHTNLTPTSIFLTLTTRENIQDRDRYFEYMRLFCKTDVFRRCFGTSYLYTVEKQKRGALHSHFICFAPLVDWFPYRELIDTWRCIVGGVGSVKVVDIDNPDNIGKYLAKYILKEFASIAKYKRVYVPSLSLQQPIKSHITYDELVERLPGLNEKTAIIDGEKKVIGWYW